MAKREEHEMAKLRVLAMALTTATKRTRSRLSRLVPIKFLPYLEHTRLRSPQMRPCVQLLDSADGFDYCLTHRSCTG